MRGERRENRMRWCEVLVGILGQEGGEGRVEEGTGEG